MTQRKIITQLIKDAVRDNPDIPSRTLAKIIYYKNKQLFFNIESVRSSIRRYRGKNGKGSLKYIIKNDKQ